MSPSFSGMRFDKLFTRDKHATGTAAWIVDTAFVRSKHLNQHTNNAGCRLARVCCPREPCCFLHGRRSAISQLLKFQSQREHSLIRNTSRDENWEWVEIKSKRRLRPGMFVAQVDGKSM